MYRTHTCGELRKSDDGKPVMLSGWVHARRDHGGLIFIDLRDRYGLTQIVADPKHPEVFNMADKLKPESTVQIKGKVRTRPAGMENKNISTGEIEVLIESLAIYSPSITPPFELDRDQDVNEEIRLKYRYLDLRRPRMQRNIQFRHKVMKMIRDYMDHQGFIEVETPMLIKGTPEGSREYIVPSRLYPEKFYVLPQSPQQLKQLLMVGGLDRYFQIVRCFRDEDQRGDRQPEFTQLDIEMSFVEIEDVLKNSEELLIELVKKFLPEKKLLKKPFPRLTWKDAMNQYGSDKPDLRFEMTITDVTEIFRKTAFKVFSDATSKNGVIKALRVAKGAQFSRKEIDELTEIAKIYEAKGLAYIVCLPSEIKSPILKFLSDQEVKVLWDTLKLQEGDIVFFTADTWEIACKSIGQVRLACGEKLGLRHPNQYAFAWITEFPLFEWSKEEQRLTSAHHPFTAPMEEDEKWLEKNPENVRAKAYDIILNGVEIGGGSIRIHHPDLQRKIFDILCISPDDAKRRFGHLIEAFQYGPPPHGGIAWGLDRLLMIFLDEPNIREVIAFPKDSKAKDLLLGAPSELPEQQIAEMHIQLKKK